MTNETWKEKYNRLKPKIEITPVAYIVKGNYDEFVISFIENTVIPEIRREDYRKQYDIGRLEVLQDLLWRAEEKKELSITAEEIKKYARDYGIDLSTT